MDKLFGQYRQFVFFLIGGGLSALIDVGIMQGLVVAGVNYITATTTGFLGGLLFNYAFHSRHTFERRSTSQNALRYLGVVFLNYLLTLFCVSVATWLHGGALVGKLVSLPLVALDGYFLGKYWIFR